MSDKEQPEPGDGGMRKRPPDYEVGYGKPPRKNRFQPGMSGNPKGRPKRRPSSADLFRKVLNTPVTVSEGGGKRKIPTEEALYRAMKQAALKGDARARRDYLDLMARYAPEQLQSITDLLAEDERLLRELRESLVEKRDASESGDADA